MVDVSNVLKIRLLAPVLTAMALVACAPSPEVQQRGNEVFDILYPRAFPSEMAKAIAARCPSLGYRYDLRTKMIQETEKDLRERGYTRADIREATRQINGSRIERDTKEYLAKNQVEEPEDLCRAGEREHARQSEIGKYLTR